MKDPSEPIEIDLAALYTRLIEGSCLHGHLLARYASGDLGAEEQRSAEHTLGDCPHCQADLARFRATDFSLGEEVRTSWTRSLGVRLAAVTAAILLGCFVVWLNLRPSEGLRLKGTFQIQIGAVRQGQAFPVTEDTRLSQGDQLGFFYTSAKAGHLAVTFASPSGEVQLLTPAGAEWSLPIAAGTGVRLADGAEVSPGGSCAWIVAVFSEKPFSTGSIAERMRAASLPNDCGSGWSASGRAALTEQGFELSILRLWLE